MWYVEYQTADGSNQKFRYEGLTREQSREIHARYSGWKANTIYVRSGIMNR